MQVEEELKESKRNFSVYELLKQYDEFLSHRFEYRATKLMYKSPVKELLKFADKKIRKPKDITSDLLIDFQHFLYQERDLSFETITSYILRIKLFFDYLIRINIIKENPAKNLTILPKPEGQKEAILRYYSFDELLRRYVNHQRRWVSYLYLHQIEKHLKGFYKYLRTLDHNTVYKVTEGIILKYRDYLWNEYSSNNREGLVPKSQRERLRCICRFFRYLYREGILRNNPTKDLGWESYYKKLFEKAKNIPKQKQKPKILSPLDELKAKFLEYETSKGKAKNTIAGYKKGLEIFFEFFKRPKTYLPWPRLRKEHC